MIGQTCVHPHDAAAHEQLKVRSLLDPIDRVPARHRGEPVGQSTGSYPLFRRRFSTSRYPTMEAFAADAKAAPIVHRAIADVGPLMGLMPAPGAKVAIPDQAFQERLRALRWGDLTRPSQPRRTVIWARDRGCGPSARSPSSWRLRSPCGGSATSPRNWWTRMARSAGS